MPQRLNYEKAAATMTRAKLFRWVWERRISNKVRKARSRRRAAEKWNRALGPGEEDKRRSVPTIARITVMTWSGKPLPLDAKVQREMMRRMIAANYDFKSFEAFKNGRAEKRVIVSLI